MLLNHGIYWGLAIIAALSIPGSFAVYQDEAYSVDFHYALLGLPQANSTFFHQPVSGSKASLLYTLSEKGVLGAVNPKDGQLVWRQQLPTQPLPNILRTGDGLDVLLTSQGSAVSAWSAADGKLVWDSIYGEEVVRDLHVTNAQESKSDAFILSKGVRSTVRKIAAASGKQAWIYEDASADEVYRVFGDAQNVYIVSLHKPLLKNLKIKVTNLDATSGKHLSDTTLDADLASYSDITGLTTDTANPLIAWITSDRSSIKVNLLGTKAIHTLPTSSVSKLGLEGAELSATGNGKDFIVNFQGADKNWAESFRIDDNASSLRKLWDIKTYDGRGVFSATSVGGNDYFVRITETEVILDSTTERLAAWPITDWGTSGSSDRAMPIHATSEVVVRPGQNYAVRSVVLLSTGDWILIRNGETSWTRCEALAGSVRAVWANHGQDLSAQGITEEASMSSSDAMIHRLRRHAKMVQALPGIEHLQSVLTRIVRQALASGVGSSFGFNRIMVLATENGRFVALNVGERGKILWNIPGQTSSHTSDPCGPELPWTPQSLTNVTGVLRCAMEKALVGDSSVDLKPSNYLFEDSAPRAEKELLRAAKVLYTIEDGILCGAKPDSVEDAWNFSPYAGFTIQSVIPPSMNDEPIASIGKVLGDRRVLYKYLNQNAVAVLTINDARKQAAVFLLDAVAGDVLWTSHLTNVDMTRPIASVMSENWLALAYTMDSISDDSVSKGHQLLMTEFYESDVPNDRGNYGSFSNYSTIKADVSAIKPFAVSQSFHVPEEIAQLAVTQTGQGITSRMLLAGLPCTNSIVGIPPQVLDPRRTVGKDPSQEQMMEGLSRYTPMIDFDPRWYLNHREEVLGLREIKTTPALLESTSLVFAYGLDIFGTRVTPSFAFDILSSSFNKIQLSLTVVGLFLGVIVVAPLIQKKQTNMLWQAT